MKEEPRAEILVSLRTMNLIGENEVPEIVELTGGVSAEIFMAKTNAGPVCLKKALPFLKVASQWAACPARVEAEKKWIRLVARFLPENVPEILAEDVPTHAFAMKYLDPVRYRNWKVLLRDGEISDKTGADAGKVLGTIHRQTAGDPNVAAAFANDQDFADLRLDPYLSAAAGRNPDIASILRNLIERTASTKLALVHGDFSPKNILIGPSGPMILDAECAWYGDPAFDPAFCLNHLFLKCVWKPQYAPQYLTCARAFWDAYLASSEWAKSAIIEERVATLLPGLMLARVDGKSPVEYLTDTSVKNKVRAFARRTLLKSESVLQSLVDAWQREFGS